MRSECHDMEIEIASAAGGDLPARVREHADGCGPCARLRQQALALARASAPGGRAPAAAARMVARRAAGQEGTRGRLAWALPLVSASASAAALILHFGIHHPAPAAQAEPGGGVEAAVEAPRATSLVKVPGPGLPDSLRAVTEMLVSREEEEEDR